MSATQKKNGGGKRNGERGEIFHQGLTVKTLELEE